jgi:hypothetical protein
MPSPSDVEGWLAGLGIEPLERADREGIVSWDLVLDGRRRFDVRITLILDPSIALIVWVHYAPPIGDGLRRSYRQLLRWNDEFPFAKFSLAEDGRPALTAEIPVEATSEEALGLAIARVLLMCDRLLDESAGWIWLGGRVPATGGRVSRGGALLDRFADRLAELQPA